VKLASLFDNFRSTWHIETKIKEYDHCWSERTFTSI